VFCAGIGLSFAARLALEASDGWAMQAAVNLLGVAALVGLAVLTAWYGAEKRAPRRPTPPLPAPVAADTR
jgi:NAD(P)-dependent dehydrogenase (short-subunit alcohol dehydrogenase family)